MSSRSTQGFWVATATLLALTTVLPAAPSSRAKVEAKLARQSNPIKKARLQVELAEISFNEGRKLYLENDPESGLEKLKEMLSWSEKSHDVLFGTGRDPRKKPSGFKKVEIKLRKLDRRVKALSLAVPFEEREEMAKITKRLLELREHLMLSIIRGTEKEK